MNDETIDELVRLALAAATLALDDGDRPDLERARARVVDALAMLEEHEPVDGPHRSARSDLMAASIDLTNRLGTNDLTPTGSEMLALEDLVAACGAVIDAARAALPDDDADHDQAVDDLAVDDLAEQVRMTIEAWRLLTGDRVRPQIAAVALSSIETSVRAALAVGGGS